MSSTFRSSKSFTATKPATQQTKSELMGSRCTRTKSTLPSTSSSSSSSLRSSPPVTERAALRSSRSRPWASSKPAQAAPATRIQVPVRTENALTKHTQADIPVSQRQQQRSSKRADILAPLATSSANQHYDVWLDIATRPSPPRAKPAAPKPVQEDTVKRALARIALHKATKSERNASDLAKKHERAAATARYEARKDQLLEKLSLSLPQPPTVNAIRPRVTSRGGEENVPAIGIPRVRPSSRDLDSTTASSRTSSTRSLPPRPSAPTPTGVRAAVSVSTSSNDSRASSSSDLSFGNVSRSTSIDRRESRSTSTRTTSNSSTSSDSQMSEIPWQQLLPQRQPSRSCLRVTSTSSSIASNEGLSAIPWQPLLPVQPKKRVTFNEVKDVRTVSRWITPDADCHDLEAVDIMGPIRTWTPTSSAFDNTYTFGFREGFHCHPNHGCARDIVQLSPTGKLLPSYWDQR